MLQLFLHLPMMGWEHKRRMSNEGFADRRFRVPQRNGLKMKMQIRKLVGVAILLSAAAASGQIAHQVQVTVPFSFVAGGKISPAGQYRVEFDYTRDLLTLSSNKFSSFILTTTTVQSGETRSYLRFHRFGDEWFLQTATFDGVAENVPLGKRGREMMVASKSAGGGPLIADIAIH
jgi:hypothetical protein